MTRGSCNIFVDTKQKAVGDVNAEHRKTSFVTFIPVTSEAGLRYHPLRLLICLRLIQFSTAISQLGFCFSPPETPVVLLILGIGNSLYKFLQSPGTNIQSTRQIPLTVNYIFRQYIYRLVINWGQFCAHPTPQHPTPQIAFGNA